MTRKAVLLSVVALAALLAVPIAVGKGKPPPVGVGCRPNVTVILKGTLTSDPGPGATSFTMNVTRANRHGQSLVGLGVTITVNGDTKIRRNGAKTVDALATGDRAVVRLQRCKGDLPLSTGTVDDVPASRVTAHPANA